MRSRPLHTVALAIVALGCAPLATPGKPPDPVREVVALEQRWLENEARPEVVEPILAEGFIHVLSAGFITKTEHLAYLRQHPERSPGTKRFEGLRVRLYGDVAIATGVVVAVSAGNSVPRRTAFTDVFARRGDRWLAVNAQETLLAPRAEEAR